MDTRINVIMVCIVKVGALTNPLIITSAILILYFLRIYANKEGFTQIKTILTMCFAVAVLAATQALFGVIVTMISCFVFLPIIIDVYWKTNRSLLEAFEALTSDITASA